MTKRSAETIQAELDAVLRRLAEFDSYARFAMTTPAQIERLGAFAQAASSQERRAPGSHEHAAAQEFP